MNPLPFQRAAINELKEKFVSLWNNEDMQLPLILKSPTGSGKTLITTHFINELNTLPNWDEDKAFIWITFNKSLAMQSKEKFQQYFSNELQNNLLTVNDINNGGLAKNDILFLNWQLIVAREAENRNLRRPDNPDERNEASAYWEDFIDRTHEENRKIILVIDEVHEHTQAALTQEAIDYINPKIILGISATPTEVPGIEDIQDNNAGFVRVIRENVVNEGLIKEKIIVQTREDLEPHNNEDIERSLLRLGIERRNALKEQFEQLEKDINPLVLIQLPNDDNRLIDMGENTKEQIVTNYLDELGIDSTRVARWFEGHEKPTSLEENNDEHDFLLFKQTAGTGWDCPRAHVLIMFRQITNENFYAQTVGRILRMAEPQNQADYAHNPDLRSGYLYTNYARDDFDDTYKEITGNKAFIYETSVRDGFAEEQDVVEFRLESSFISRVDYGDLADSAQFQRSFISSMNNYFDIDINMDIEMRKNQLHDRGVDIDPTIERRLIVNVEISDFDNFITELERQGEDEVYEMSQNDIEKSFGISCLVILREQDDEDARITNISRSSATLKSALRVWFKSVFGANNNSTFYRVFVHDIFQNEASIFRPAITQALIEYRPILNRIIDDRRERQINTEIHTFSVVELKYRYTEDYDEIIVGDKCLMDRCFLSRQPGRRNEEQFINYIDNAPRIRWWLKNADSGMNAFSIKYLNTRTNRESLFYPDWIIQFEDGQVGIFDTKGGYTLNTEGKARGLSLKLNELGPDRFVGGIVRLFNGAWEYCDSEDYNDQTPEENYWRNVNCLMINEE